MTQDNPNTQPKPNHYPPWAPRFWGGMRFTDYIKLLIENRFAVHITKYPMLVLVGVCSIINSLLSAIQWLLLGRKIQATKIEKPPIFIIGHWRSGTTLMHELMVLDESRTYPNNFQAFIPHHFLISGWLLFPIVNLLMPKKRPMDDMALSAAAPQEDDFALISLGAPTPYRKVAFSRSRSKDHLLLNLSQTDPTTVEKIKRGILYFFKALTLKSGKQLIVKSPPHTGRLKQLSEWFPGAKFIHLSRHPHKMVPSTVRLWQLLEQTQGFQVTKEPDHWKEHVFACKDLMYDAYREFKDELPANQLVEVQFEQLVANPEAEILRVHQQLELDGAEELLPKITAYFERKREHRTNKNQIDQLTREEIDRHWSNYIQEFGYEAANVEVKSA